MSTLESCADALLQQKVVQASNYERLEARLMEMERAKRSLFFGLKEVITDVERRSQDLVELKHENARLQQQLQQGNVKFGALAIFIKDEQRKATQLQEALEGCETAWTGWPAQVALVVRALQERQAFRQQLSIVVGVLERVKELVTALRRVEEIRSQLLQRVGEHSAEVERLNGAYQKQRQQADNQKREHEQGFLTAIAEVERLRCDARRLELRQLVKDAELSKTRVESLEAEERNGLCCVALQGALTAADNRAAEHERVKLSLKLALWLCEQMRVVAAATKARSVAVSDTINNWLEALRGRCDQVRNKASLAERQRVVVTAEVAATRALETVAQHRHKSLRLLRVALRFLYSRLRVRASEIHRERSQREEELSRARKAQEARLFARRLLVLQREARDGLCAEELLTRRALTEVEETACQEAAAQHKLCLEALKEKELQQGTSSQGVEELISVPKSLTRVAAPLKTVLRRARTTAQTDKKRPRSPPDQTLLGRKTYPQASQRDLRDSDGLRKTNGDKLPSVLPLGPPHAAATRLPSDARAARCCVSPAVRGVPTRSVHNEEKRSQRCKENLVSALGPIGRVSASPLPRRPVLLKPSNATSSITGAPKEPLPHGPRPSLLTKEPWGKGGKFEDVFADMFSS